MKTKKLKLSLKKDVISNLQAKTIVGGDNRLKNEITGDVQGGTCISPENGTCNSANGCHGGPLETMTCANWSCAC